MAQDPVEPGNDIFVRRGLFVGFERFEQAILNKVFSAKFAKSGSPAYKVLKRFSWSNKDQEIVAKWIAGDHMNPDKAGKKWVAANQAKVNKWLGK